jgi:hypothetical protein
MFCWLSQKGHKGRGKREEGRGKREEGRGKRGKIEIKKLVICA